MCCTWQQPRLSIVLSSCGWVTTHRMQHGQDYGQLPAANSPISSQLSAKKLLSAILYIFLESFWVRALWVLLPLAGTLRIAKPLYPGSTGTQLCSTGNKHDWFMEKTAAPEHLHSVCRRWGRWQYHTQGTKPLVPTMLIGPERGTGSAPTSLQADLNASKPMALSGRHIKALPLQQRGKQNNLRRSARASKGCLYHHKSKENRVNKTPLNEIVPLFTCCLDASGKWHFSLKMLLV